MNELPPEILWTIMEGLPLQMLWRLRRVSSRFRAVVMDYLHRHKYKQLQYRLYDEVMFCVRQSNIDGVRFWLNVNAHVNSRFANRVWNSEIFRLLTEYFQAAVDKGKTEIARLLLENGAEMDWYFSAALRNAVFIGHTATVQMLLEHGADTSAENEEPLRVAAGSGHTEIVRLLLKHGADVNAPDAMKWAVLGGHTEIVRLLIVNGSRDGSIALRIATQKKQTKMVEMLHENGVKL